jgi:uncharacterized membrane protein
MAFSAHHVTAPDGTPMPAVRKIGLADLRDALAQGVDDFWAMPTTNVVFLSLIYPVVGLLLFRLMFGYDIVPLLFPMAAGFALLGPLAAIWLYELSRRREAGLDISWRHAFDVLRSPSFGAIAALGCALMVTFLVWLAVANAIYVAHFGYAPPETLNAFLHDVFFTPTGWSLIVVGNAVGFLFALVVLAVSVVSFPLLVDRHVSPIEAAAVSIEAVLKNPGPMAVWGLIVAALLVLGSLPAFIGLAVVMPILGHATWHLYRKVVEPDPRIPQEPPQRERGRRYAAEFPASLFVSTKKERP